MSNRKINRRAFLGTSVATSLALAAPELKRAKAEAPPNGKISLGLIADVHQDIMHDGVHRIKAFVSAMQEQQAHGIVNLGDFCVPHSRNDEFLAAWNTFPFDKFHVLGNHDTDGGYRREHVIEYYGSRGRFFSQDFHGLHLVILDGNDPDGKPGYPCNVNDEQIEWLESDLQTTQKPSVIMIHQPIDDYNQHIRSSHKIREVLAKANHDAGFRKVLIVLAGHAHLDYLKESDGIPHLQINSASYVWVEKKHLNYAAEIQATHPWLANTCPYAEPLWACIIFDTNTGEMTVEGRQTKWVGPDPWEIGLAEDDYQKNRDLCRPAISSRRINSLDLRAPSPPQH
jgi:3',5'-cyclic-AMP phosphodiesterase